jgi:glycosyltransferase involved in cell wall biosynthesis
MPLSSSSPLVSVIISFLNEEKFLGEAVESVLQQDYSCWQLLLIDDGSTDNSTAIAKVYAEKYAGKIIYYEHDHHVNKGLSASRNFGIQQATGELIAILDADDIWTVNKLSDQVHIFQRYHALDMVMEASVYWYSWGNSAGKDIAIPIGAPANKVYQPAELLYLLYPLASGAAPCPSGLMLTKQAWHDVGGFEESYTKKYQLYEDQAFLSKMYLKKQVYVSVACNNYYRQRPGSIVQAVTEQGHYHSVRAFFLEWFSQYLITEKQVDSRLNALLAKALFPYHHPFLYRVTTSLKNLINKIAN